MNSQVNSKVNYKINYIEDYFSRVITTLNKIDKDLLLTCAQLIMTAHGSNRMIFAFGNGGSGSTASHFIGDMIKSLSCRDGKRFKAICLNDNIPVLMAIANDISYEDIFVEQLKNFVKQDDIVIAFSGSGNSANIVKAFEYANQVGACTIAFCGYDGGKINKMAKLSLHAAIDDMEVSEDVHLIFVHCIKQMLLKEINSSSK